MNGHKRFAFDIIVTFLASIANAIIAFPISIILGRYLGAGDLGLYYMVFAIYNAAMLFVTIGIPAAIIKFIAGYQDDKTRVNLFISSGLFISTFLGIVALGIFFISSKILADIFEMPELAHLIRIMSFALPFSVTANTLLGALNGLRFMKKYAIAVLIQTTFSLFFTLFFTYFGYGISGVIYGIVISSIIFDIYLIMCLRNNIVKTSISNIIYVSKKLIPFGFQTVIANSLNLINYQADTVMIGYFLTKIDVGYYSVAVIFAKIIWLIPDAIQKVTYPMLSQYYSQKKSESVNQVVTSTLTYTSCILSIIATILLVCGKEMITLIYGISFTESIISFYILVIGTTFFGFQKSVGSVLYAIDKASLFTRIPLVSAIVNLILNFLLIPVYGIMGAAIATAISLILYTLLMLHIVKKELNVIINFNWFFMIITVPLISLELDIQLVKVLNTNIASIISILLCIILVMLLLNKKEKGTIENILKSIYIDGKSYFQ